MAAIRKLYNTIMSKSVMQRIIICIVAVVLLTFLFFIIKANFFDIPLEPSEGSEPSDRPQFHISLVDMGLLAAVIGAYIIHRIHEKRKRRR